MWQILAFGFLGIVTGAVFVTLVLLAGKYNRTHGYRSRPSAQCTASRNALTGSGYHSYRTVNHWTRDQIRQREQAIDVTEVWPQKEEVKR